MPFTKELPEWGNAGQRPRSPPLMKDTNQWTIPCGLVQLVSKYHLSSIEGIARDRSNAG